MKVSIRYSVEKYTNGHWTHQSTRNAIRNYKKLNTVGACERKFEKQNLTSTSRYKVLEIKEL